MKGQDSNTEQAEWRGTWGLGRVILEAILSLLDFSRGLLGLCGDLHVVFVFPFHPERLGPSLPT